MVWCEDEKILGKISRGYLLVATWVNIDEIIHSTKFRKNPDKSTQAIKNLLRYNHEIIKVDHIEFIIQLIDKNYKPNTKHINDIIIFFESISNDDIWWNNYKQNLNDSKLEIESLSKYSLTKVYLKI